MGQLKIRFSGQIDTPAHSLFWIDPGRKIEVAVEMSKSSECYFSLFCEKLDVSDNQLMDHMKKFWLITNEKDAYIDWRRPQNIRGALLKSESPGSEHPSWGHHPP